MLQPTMLLAAALAAAAVISGVPPAARGDVAGGVVIDVTTGRPLRGVIVTALIDGHKGKPPETVTAPDGTYRLDLPPGPVTLSFELVSWKERPTTEPRVWPLPQAPLVPTRLRPAKQDPKVVAALGRSLGRLVRAEGGRRDAEHLWFYLRGSSDSIREKRAVAEAFAGATDGVMKLAELPGLSQYLRLPQAALNRGEDGSPAAVAANPQALIPAGELAGVGVPRALQADYYAGVLRAAADAQGRERLLGAFAKAGVDDAVRNSALLLAGLPSSLTPEQPDTGRMLLERGFLNEAAAAVPGEPGVRVASSAAAAAPGRSVRAGGHERASGR